MLADGTQLAALSSLDVKMGQHVFAQWTLLAQLQLFAITVFRSGRYQGTKTVPCWKEKANTGACNCRGRSHDCRRRSKKSPWGWTSPKRRLCLASTWESPWISLGPQGNRLQKLQLQLKLRQLLRAILQKKRSVLKRKKAGQELWFSHFSEC